MSATRRCPQCDRELSANAPDGLCPACLMKGGLATESPAAEAHSGRPFIPPKPAELAQHFPQLEILDLVGQGGMGAVYKARQRGLDRIVALKILPPEFGRDPAFAERFTREARALARLSHPHIVTVHDVGKAGGLYFLIMEYVDGVNLREAISHGRIDPKEALAIIPQICEALQFAHDAGIVHRDIKPENILLDRQGRVKIADFGLAKLLDMHLEDFTLTRDNQTMGTPRYMAPEQIEQTRAVDHRADIYSLGVVFYELLTGELPIGRFAPPSQRVQLDVRLDGVVLRTLEKEPERRFQNASEVKTQLESIAASPAPAAPQPAAFAHPTPRTSHGTSFVVAMVVLLCLALCCVPGMLIMVASWAYIGTSVERVEARPSVRALELPPPTETPAPRVVPLPRTIPPPLETPEGATSMLQFYIVPNIGDEAAEPQVTKEQFEALKQKIHGSPAGDDRFQWVQVMQGVGGDDLPTVVSGGGRFMLLSRDTPFSPDGPVTVTEVQVQEMGQTSIGFELTAQDGQRLSTLTATNIGNRMAIVLRGEIVSAPTIRGTIARQGQITGAFSEKDIPLLVRALNSVMGKDAQP